MTSEKAIQLLHRLQDEQFDGIHGDERREALDMAVRALVDPNIGQKTIDCIIERLNDEDRTTGDTIYRRDAIDEVINLWADKPFGNPTLVEIKGCIEALPSAQPQRKKGRWIPVDSFSAFGGDEAMWMAHGNPVAFYYCSECKEQAYAGEDGESLLTDFCPFCGADMRGESDDQ